MLHALYGEAVRHNCKFFVEYYVLDLLMDDDGCHGVLAWNLEDGTMHRFKFRPILTETMDNDFSGFSLGTL